MYLSYSLLYFLVESPKFSVEMAELKVAPSFRSSFLLSIVTKLPSLVTLLASFAVYPTDLVTLDRVNCLSSSLSFIFLLLNNKRSFSTFLSDNPKLNLW